MNGAFLDYYGCPESFASFALTGELSERSGYFQFGRDAICYGRSCSGHAAKRPTDDLHDALTDVGSDGSILRLPFSPSEVAANLCHERYASSNGNGDGREAGPSSALRKAYYTVRPVLSIALRKHLQRMCLRNWKKISFPSWPVDLTVEVFFERLMALLLKTHAVDQIPFIWFWPDGFSSCAIITHDVEALAGWDFCSALMDLDDAYGTKASFQFVPEGQYLVSREFLKEVRDRGFEINIHDLNHDGLLFSDHDLFLHRAEHINRYARDFGAEGFRSAILYRNLDWFEALDFSYDMSVPNVGHLEGQRGGCCSIMPFFIGKILELPLTTTQDYSVFHILNQYSIDLCIRQLTLIIKKHGLASFIFHPDYLREPRAQDTYKVLLGYLAELRSDKRVWMPLPREVNHWWRRRSQMRLVFRGNRWVIEGQGKERARIAYASLEGNRVQYRLDATQPGALAPRSSPLSSITSRHSGLSSFQEPSLTGHAQAAGYWKRNES